MSSTTNPPASRAREPNEEQVMSIDHDALMQALHDPENQPSQYGTVPVEMAESSRRERIATAAMQGLLASLVNVEEFRHPNLVAAESLAYADALIAELDKEA